MWEQAESGRVSHPFEPFVLGATLALIPVLIIEHDVPSGPWATFAQVANWVIWAIFAAELVFIFTVAPRKKAALRAHLLDAAIVVITPPVWGSVFSSVRLFRLFRLARAMIVIARAVQAERRLTSTTTFRFVALGTVFLTVGAGAVMETIDHEDFTSFWNGVWWAVVTVTTVGYGDVVPHSVPGRLVAIVLMFTGIGFIAVLTATVSSMFVKTDRSDETTAILETLARIEADLSMVKTRLDAQPGPHRDAGLPQEG